MLKCQRHFDSSFVRKKYKPELLASRTLDVSKFLFFVILVRSYLHVQNLKNRALRCYSSSLPWIHDFVSVEEFFIDSVYSVFVRFDILPGANGKKIKSRISPEREPAISWPSEGL